MFEATLHAADPDRQRLQRLTLSAAIALSATTTVLASMWTLDRLHIDRIHGPAQPFELLQLSLLPPPTVQPPPPPPPDFEKPTVAVGGSTATVTDKPDKPDDPDDATISTATEIPPVRPTGAQTGNIPDFSGAVGCPGGVCVGTNTSTGTGQPLIIGDPAPKTAAAPTEVEFSALRCLVCADPDQAALRKTSANMPGRSGRVTVRFCVDLNGRVEASSIAIERSYGDAAVDRITRAAIKNWRFSPMKVGNKPRRACSRADFNIRFD